jgi:probable rRNA maturation factor
MSLRVEIAVESAGWDETPDLSAHVGRAIAAARRLADVTTAPAAEVSLLFTDDAHIRQLNAQWRGQDKPTNVLSFPGAGEIETAPLLGDIALAFETTAREAREQGKPLADHVAHLVVHGFLHLVGYDHKTDGEAEEMEALERAILKHMGVPDPYAGTSPANEPTEP